MNNKEKLNTQSTYKGLHQDFIKENQPDNTYSYCLNGIINNNFNEKEESNQLVDLLPDGYTIVGDIYLEDNNSILFLKGNTYCEIGLFTNNNYQPIINSSLFNFSNSVNGTYRKKNNERIIYFVDGINPPLTINIDNLESYYSNEYVEWLDNLRYNNDEILKSLITSFVTDDFSTLSISDKLEAIYQYFFGRTINAEELDYWTSVFEFFIDEALIFQIVSSAQNEDKVYSDNLIYNYSDNYNFEGEKWDYDKFKLVKSYSKIPKFESLQVINGGNILPGSYSFAIQYLDQNLNSTNWITTSNTVNIYNSPITNEYYTIRGSRNIDSALMTYGRTNKAIKIVISNFDIDYPYYKIAIIQANEMTGISNKALVSEIKSISDSLFIYSGNDESLTEISLSEIAIDKDYINEVEHIQQLENRLILASGSGSKINFTKFQKYASKISSHLVTKRVYLNSMTDGNSKKPYSSKGYMPGEVYSFGIVYVMKDGSLSPVFHIPGRNKNDNRIAVNGFDDNLDYYENENSYYHEIHKEIGESDYWGIDSYGEQLANRNKRFHKFPFRKDRNLPLYEKANESVNLYKYKLTLNISLKDNQEYPINSNTQEPLIIDAIVNYGKENTSSINQYFFSINSNSVNKSIIIYEDSEKLKYVQYRKYGYLTGEILRYTHLFNIDFEYEEIIDEILDPAYYTDIMGINFDNIEKPHDDVVGYFIVRNKKEDSDKCIIDNAIFGNTVEQKFGSVNYNVFNKWICKVNGEQVSTEGVIGSGSKRDISFDSLYFYSPEHQFLNKQFNFDSINIQGVYNTNRKITSINNGEPPNTGDYDQRKYSVVIKDTMEGTSYNSEVHADKDDDGFNLLIGYRNINVDYNQLSIENTWNENEIEELLYLNAASSRLYNGTTFYNSCQDNKIGIIKFKESIINDGNKALLFNEPNFRNIYYGSLTINNPTSYNNFIDRDYYKEHNNVIEFKDNNYGNTLNIFNGDSYVIPISPVATTYIGMKMANRKKKDKKCSGILGIGLIIIGVVATVFTAGAALGVFGAALSTTAITVAGSALASMALSAGASMYSSHIQLEELKKMIQEEYPKGLQSAISDLDITEHASNNDPYGCGLKDGTSSTDDSINWFGDRLTDVFIETCVNGGLRTSLTNVGIDFINPLNTIKNSAFPLNDGVKITTSTSINLDGYDDSEFRAYLTEKLTVVDPENSDGRLYRGYAHAEWYDINPDFGRINTEKIFIHMPISYNIPSDSKKQYQNRIWWSQQSFQEEIIDNYRIFLPNNYKDIEGEYGTISNLFRINNNLFIHTTEGLWRLPQNIQEKITNELTTYIGTGEFFAIPLVKISSINGGLKYKKSYINTEYGIVYVDSINRKVYLFDGQNNIAISDNGMSNWFNENLKDFLINQLSTISNTTIVNNINIITGYDKSNDRLLITKNDYELVDPSNFKGIYDPKKTDYSINDKIIKDGELKIIDSIDYVDCKDIDLSKAVINDVVSFKNFSLVGTLSDEGGTIEKDNNTITYTPPIDYIGNDIINIKMDDIINQISINVINSLSETSSLPFNYVNSNNKEEQYDYYGELTVTEWGSINTLYFSVRDSDSIIINKTKINKFKSNSIIPTIDLPTPFTKKYYLNRSTKDDLTYTTILNSFGSNEISSDGKGRTGTFGTSIVDLSTLGLEYNKSISKETVQVEVDSFSKKWTLSEITENTTLNVINKTNIPHTIIIRYNDIVLFTDIYNTWDNRRILSLIPLTFVSGINYIELEISTNSWYSSNISFNEKIDINISI